MIEHLEDPGLIMHEISRIGRGGYIEVPTKVEDQLFSVDGLKDASGKLVYSERLRLVEKGFSQEERNCLA